MPVSDLNQILSPLVTPPGEALALARIETVEGVVLVTDEEMRAIDALFPAGSAAGTRYAEAGMKTLNR